MVAPKACKVCGKPPLIINDILNVSLLPHALESAFLTFLMAVVKKRCFTGTRK